jgi:hypothetical protein
MLRPKIPVIACGPGRFPHQVDALIIAHYLPMDFQSLGELAMVSGRMLVILACLTPQVTTNLIAFPSNRGRDDERSRR